MASLQAKPQGSLARTIQRMEWKGADRTPLLSPASALTSYSSASESIRIEPATSSAPSIRIEPATSAASNIRIEPLVDIQPVVLPLGPADWRNILANFKALTYGGGWNRRPSLLREIDDLIYGTCCRAPALDLDDIRSTAALKALDKIKIKARAFLAGNTEGYYTYNDTKAKRDRVLQTLVLSIDQLFATNRDLRIFNLMWRGGIPRTYSLRITDDGGLDMVHIGTTMVRMDCAKILRENDQEYIPTVAAFLLNGRITLYRGMSRFHPKWGAAIQGRAVPFGTAGPAFVTGNSAFTPWSVSTDSASLAAMQIQAVGGNEDRGEQIEYVADYSRSDNYAVGLVLSATVRLGERALAFMNSDEVQVHGQIQGRVHRVFRMGDERRAGVTLASQYPAPPTGEEQAAYRKKYGKLIHEGASYATDI